jgi:hypothetical protein
VPSLFVLSTGRTATTWIAAVFEHAGARAVHEPEPRWLRLIGNAHAAGALSRDRAVRAVRKTRTDVVSAGGGPYVEANSLISGLAGPLLDAFDDARVVQIVRDPVSYVRSAMAWGQYRTAGRVLNIVPYRRLAAPQFHPFSVSERLRWARHDQFERLCWTWTAQNRAMRTQGEGNPRFRVLQFEQLIDEVRGLELLGELFSDLGLTADAGAVVQAASVAKNESAPRGAKVDLDPGHLRRLWEVCGAEAEYYGYSPLGTASP